MRQLMRQEAGDLVFTVRATHQTDGNGDHSVGISCGEAEKLAAVDPDVEGHAGPRRVFKQACGDTIQIVRHRRRGNEAVAVHSCCRQAIAVGTQTSGSIHSSGCPDACASRCLRVIEKAIFASLPVGRLFGRDFAVHDREGVQGPVSTESMKGSSSPGLLPKKATAGDAGPSITASDRNTVVMRDNSFRETRANAIICTSRLMLRLTAVPSEPLPATCSGQGGTTSLERLTSMALKPDVAHILRIDFEAATFLVHN